MKDDEAASSAKAKAVLEKIIQDENKRSPFSDSALTKELEKYRITLSRRTVAKYREALGLPNAADRKHF
jgi:RNA polymerase sigma-54 factor